ncbi:MAG: hypothetical protein HPZ91_02785 [Lentisphaeria bacterium]|nr:hypothetical protein [Lentisphaeria bacterium]
MQENKFKAVPEEIGKFAFGNYDNFAQWRAAALPELKRLLGYDRLEKLDRRPVVPESLWKRETSLGTIEKIRFSPEEGEFACVYVCLPSNVKPPYRSFICLQGHSTGMHNSIAVRWQDETQELEVAGDRDFAIGCMRRGIAAFCLEQRYMGERSSDPDHKTSCLLPTLQNLMIGRTAIGDRIYDVDRLIDWLYTRNDLDFSRIGVMGNSGGGTTSMFAGPLLGRITHIIASCSFSSFRGSIGSMFHCACNYVPHLLEFGESADVAGLAAPKPLVIVNGNADDIFPVGEANRQFARLKAIYRAAGAEELCLHAVGEGGHRFYAREAWDAMLKMF